MIYNEFYIHYESKNYNQPYTENEILISFLNILLLGNNFYISYTSAKLLHQALSTNWKYKFINLFLLIISSKWNLFFSIENINIHKIKEDRFLHSWIFAHIFNLIDNTWWSSSAL